MLCPFCKSSDSRVLETRTHGEGDLRRRRECEACKARFTTTETVVIKMPYVVKRDGGREPFLVEKLRRGLQLACLKRPVSLSHIEKIVADIQNRVLQRNEREVQSLEIGKYVMKELKGLDDVAYVRFASVYKSFKDVHEFVESLSHDLKMIGTEETMTELNK